MSFPILTVNIKHEYDVVAARQRARQIAEGLGLEGRDRARIATAVSEIARNSFAYGGGGKVEFSIEGTLAPQVLLVRISDRGPGVAELEDILDGRYQSPTGLGLGIIGARRLVDRFDIESSPETGTVVSLRKILPPRSARIDAAGIRRLVDMLSLTPSANPLDEIQAQNQELSDSLYELRIRQDELLRLNQELQDTNRGVIALYSELDEKADHLRRADEIKGKFLSNMSHEFRTPLNSTLALSRLLLDRADGELNPEQEKQVMYIRKAAEELSELVNDLLDLAKVEAGKIVIRPGEFQVANLLSALRGMLRPLLLNENVNLIIEEPDGVPLLYSDEAKVSQILRNFISNALKFTERGEVRVSAKLDDDGNHVVFAVADTGIGIAPENQERIFQEFGQVENPIQKRVRGTGLGLPLSKKLAELLGGSIALSSRLGVGSTFTLTLPLVYFESAPPVHEDDEQEPNPERIPVLVIEDNPQDLLLYERFLANSEYQMRVARNVRQARDLIKIIQPGIIILDILLQQEAAWGFLAELKTDPLTKNIPLLVVSTYDDAQKGLGLGADAYAVKPVERTWLLERLRTLRQRQERPLILVIEDEEPYRYILQHYFSTMPYDIATAANAAEGVRLARQLRPQVILLDLNLPDSDGFQVLSLLRADAMTCTIPVIILTARVLDSHQVQTLRSQSFAVLTKTNLQPQELVDTVTLAFSPRAAGQLTR